jgi:hypothetical protein
MTPEFNSDKEYRVREQFEYEFEDGTDLCIVIKVDSFCKGCDNCNENKDECDSLLAGKNRVCFERCHIPF